MESNIIVTNVTNRAPGSYSYSYRKQYSNKMDRIPTVIKCNAYSYQIQLSYKPDSWVVFLQLSRCNTVTNHAPLDCIPTVIDAIQLQTALQCIVFLQLSNAIQLHTALLDHIPTVIKYNKVTNRTPESYSYSYRKQYNYLQYTTPLIIHVSWVYIYILQ